MTRDVRSRKEIERGICRDTQRKKEKHRLGYKEERRKGNGRKEIRTERKKTEGNKSEEKRREELR